MHIVVEATGEGLERALELTTGQALMLMNAPTRTIVAPWVSEALAERAAGSAIAPIPLQQLSVVGVGRTAGECVHARMLYRRCLTLPGVDFAVDVAMSAI